MRPPQGRLEDVDVPLDLILAQRKDVVLLIVHVAVDQGPDSNGALDITVEMRRQANMGTPIVGIPAQHAEPLDADRAGVVHVDGSPDAARDSSGDRDRPSAGRLPVMLHRLFAPE